MSTDFWGEIASVWDGTAGDMPAYVKALVDSEATDLDVPIYEDLTVRAFDDLFQLVQVSAGGRLRAARKDELLKRFGWLLTTLRDWDGPSDPKGRRLLCTLVVANAWEVQGSDLWTALSPSLQGCIAVTEALDKVLSNIRIIVTLPPTASKSDHDIFDRLRESDRNGDYGELAALTRSFQTLQYPLLVAASRALYEVSLERVIAAAARLSTWLETVSFMAGLDPARRYRVAEHSDLPRIQFAALILTANRPLETNETPAIQSLLLQLARNQSAWHSFLSMLKHSAVAGLPLPDMLGTVLAKAPRCAIEEYAHSISLDTLDGNFIQGMATLAEFRRNATLDKRLVLWRIAYERWDAWNFDESSSDTYLVGPVQSNVDLAVIGWLVEGVSEDFVEDQLHRTLEKFLIVEQTWYASITSFTSTINRLRSRYAIFALAVELRSHANREDWLSYRKDLLPESLDSPYIKARYIGME